MQLLCVSHGAKYFPCIISFNPPTNFAYMSAKLLQLCPTLLRPYVLCSLPGSSGRGIFQARILEWVAMSSSRGSLQPKDQTHTSYVSYIGRQVLCC